MERGWRRQRRRDDPRPPLIKYLFKHAGSHRWGQCLQSTSAASASVINQRACAAALCSCCAANNARRRLSAALFKRLRRRAAPLECIITLFKRMQHLCVPNALARARAVHAKAGVPIWQRPLGTDWADWADFGVLGGRLGRLADWADCAGWADLATRGAPGPGRDCAENPLFTFLPPNTADRRQWPPTAVSGRQWPSRAVRRLGWVHLFFSEPINRQAAASLSAGRPAVAFRWALPRVRVQLRQPRALPSSDLACNCTHRP